MDIGHMFYPECAIRSERMATRDMAIDCANKTARLSSAVLMGIVVTIAIIIIAASGADYKLYILIAGGAILAIANIMLAGTFAGRKWDANNMKIQQMMAMSPNMSRADVAETVVRENMQQEQLEATQQMADATSRNATANSVNAATNVWNSFGRR